MRWQWGQLPAQSLDSLTRCLLLESTRCPAEQPMITQLSWGLLQWQVACWAVASVHKHAKTAARTAIRLE